MPKDNWTREQLIVAFNLYCKIPFGKIHIRNPEIIALAKLIGRTPSAVSWKLANFAHLDPSLKSRAVEGAAHISRSDRAIWNEFNGNWEQLVFESERLLAQMAGRKLLGRTQFPEGRSVERIVRVRTNQSFFRSAILAAYNGRCCVTGIGTPDLLSASHIVPWIIDPANRTNPRNGLCLNALHDRAFDCGLITVTPDFIVRVSTTIPASEKRGALSSFLFEYEGQKITVPERFSPDPLFLKFHNEKVFRSDA